MGLYNRTDLSECICSADDSYRVDASDHYDENRYNILFVIDDIVDNDTTRMLANLANYYCNSRAGVVFFTKHLHIAAIFDKNVKVIAETSSISTTSLESVCRAYKINVVCICSLKYAEICSIVTKKLNILYISIIFDVFCEKKEQLSYDTYVNFIQSCQLIITASEYVCDFLLSNYKFDVDRLLVLHSGVDCSIFNQENVTRGRIAAVLDSTDPDLCRKRILFCPCDFNKINECLKLLNALRNVKDRYDFVCVFSGIFHNTHDSRIVLLEKVKELSLQDNVRIINSVFDRVAMYALSYAVICVQRDGNDHDLTQREAAFMERPVLAVNVGSYVTDVVDGKTGYLVYKNSITDISTCVEKMLSLTNDEYLNMCKNALAYAKKYFNVGRFCEEFDSAISHLLSNDN